MIAYSADIPAGEKAEHSPAIPTVNRANTKLKLIKPLEQQTLPLPLLERQLPSAGKLFTAFITNTAEEPEMRKAESELKLIRRARAQRRNFRCTIAIF